MEEGGRDEKAFMRLIEEGIEKIPERFRSKIKNVAFLVADLPTLEQLRENGVPDGDTLLGLYEGIPLTERGEYYGVGMVLPDTITIFRLPILEEAGGDMEALRGLVVDTVWHEVAHYFGYDDPEIMEREIKGTNHSA